MGWISNDNLHEGYLEVVLVDGSTSSTSNARGPVVMVHDAAGNYTGEEVQRSDDEVVGWRLACDCASETSFGPVARWEGPYFERVATAALEDLDGGRLFVRPGDHATDMSDRGDVETMFTARWLSEHVSPLEALDTIRTSRAEITAATQRLDQAVAYARAAGQTWEAIGRAAGMTRQSAQERWSSPSS